MIKGENETDQKKLKRSKEGKQYVEDTEKAKRTREEASTSDEDDGKKEYVDEGEGTDEDVDMVDDDVTEDDKENTQQLGQKRKTNEQQANSSNKKQKSDSSKPNGTVGSKHMYAEEPAPKGSKDRLPVKGQKATWKAMPGYVDGEVVDVLKENKEVDGKSTKASKDDPKIVLKSEQSGNICVHKPDACFYYM